MDIQYLLALQSFRDATGGVLNGFFDMVSYVDITFFSLIIPALVLWCISKEAGMYVMLSMGFANWVNQIVKNIACVYRPWIRSSDIHPVESAKASATGYSFPSGHTTTAVASMGGVAVWWRKKKWLVVLCVFGILLVGFSRNYLGVHTPQDVLVAMLLSSGSLVAVWFLLKWVEGGRNRDIVVVVGAIALTCIMLVFCTLKSYPIDYASDGSILVEPSQMIRDCYMTAGCMMGAFVAWFIERRWIRFRVDGSVLERIVRFVVGALVALCTLLFAAAPLYALLGEFAGRFVLYFTLFLFAGAIYPLIFWKVHQALVRRKGLPDDPGKPVELGALADPIGSAEPIEPTEDRL